MLHDVFLDFLNRDSRQIYGLFTDALPELHIEILNEAINVAACLCREFCVMPPLFLADDELVQKALSRCEELLTDGIIRMPLREGSLDVYFEKKEKEYGAFRNVYPVLLDPRSQALLRRYPTSLMARSARIGDQIAREWEEDPDKGAIWPKLIPGVKPREVERIRRLPRLIQEKGLAIVWPALKKEIGDNVGADPRLLRHALQHHYFSVYLRELDLRVVTSLPFTRDISFDPELGDLRYDYRAIQGALRSVRLWEIVRSMSARSLIHLRAEYGFMAFRKAFDEIASNSRSTEELSRAFALGAKRVRSVFEATRILDEYGVGVNLPYGTDLTYEETDAVAARLEAVSQPAVEAFGEIRAGHATKRWIGVSGEPKADETVAIFAALPMERGILTKAFGLRGDHAQRVFSGELGARSILVFGPNDMARVPAAVETMRLLYNCQDRKPSLIVVAGIAGGFKERGVELGHIIIARRVIDLAARKLRTRRKVTVPEFRELVYPTDERLQHYLEYNPQEYEAWLQGAVSDVGWPAGLRPTIHYGDIASVDEVVSSGAWRRRLLNAWPRLLGVEMEAGGVCAAALHFAVPVVVVRGVADLADPAKADTQWRTLAMRTVAHLLQHMGHKLAL